MAFQFRLYIAISLLMVTSAAIANRDLAADTTARKADRVIITSGSVSRRFLNDYHYAVLKLALEHTEAEYGPFSIETFDADIFTARILRKLEDSEDEGGVNVHVATASPIKEQRLDAIHIPLRMGLLGYRLLVVHKKNLETFSKIRTLEELRQYRAGSGARWTTTTTLAQQGFSIVEFPHYDRMYSMLDRERFDFVLRGVSEIYYEWETCKEACKNLAVVPDIQVYLPVPYYIFVSKRHPRIFKRIEAGLLAAVHDGSLKSLFMQHHLDFLKRANIANRHVISIPNQGLATDPAVKTPEFWLSPCDMQEIVNQADCAGFGEILAAPLTQQ